MKKLRVGIIGLGIISTAHEEGFRSVSDLAEIHTICDINEERAKARALPYQARIETNYEKVLANPEIDMVDIILPHDLHYPVCKAALLAGKHVLMEKPMTIDPAHAVDLIALAAKQGVQFMVAENTRFVKAYLEVEKLLNAQSLGEIYLIRTFIAGTEIYRMVDASNWKGRKDGSGGGVIMDAAPHSFYLLKWLFGEIAEVKAYANQIVPGSEVEDNAIIMGKLKNGAQFNLEFSFTAQAPWTERLEVYGSKGSVVVDQIVNPPTIHYANSEDYHPTELPGVPYNPKGWKTISIASGVEEFVKAVAKGADVPVQLLDTYYAIEACAAAYRSLQSNQAEVIQMKH